MRPEMARGNDISYPFVFTADSPLIAVYRTLEKVLESPTTVLIEGESGTGKDALAQWLHYNSPRKDGPFIKIDFASLPEDLVESELFGYERGAFTGACQFETRKTGSGAERNSGPRRNRKHRSDGSGQAAECRRSETVLSPRRNEIDRARCKDRRAFEHAAGQSSGSANFRQDLFFRLNLITIRVPPLRERRNEIFPMAEFLLEQLDRKYRTGSKLHSRLPCRFPQYDFPGNIRELRNALERASCSRQRQEITPEALPPAWHMARSSSSSKMPSLEDIERN